MGRAGGGGHSGGGHSSSRSGGGHHVGGGGGSSFGGFSGGSHHSGGSYHGGGYNRSGYRGGSYRGTGGGGYAGPGCGGGCVTYLIIIILLIWLSSFGSLVSCVSYTMSNIIPTKIITHSADNVKNKNNNNKTTTSTKNRKKLDDVAAYDNNCVIDELNWVGDTKQTGVKLKAFYNKTGIQPYIMFRQYDPTLTTDEQKEKWTIDYYDQNIKEENVFLYVYFAEEDTDNDVGYMTYALGQRTEGILDDEAISIFWENIDKNWYSDQSTDDVMINSFNDTADEIMRHKTSWKDFVKWILIILAIAIAGVIIINLVKEKNKRDKEKAEEDQKILETPVHDIADDLTQKYTEENKEKKEAEKQDDVETIDPNDIDII